MNVIPDFPSFVPITASMYGELYPFLNDLPDGISEFTFLNLYLYRAKYDYRICRFAQDGFAVSGKDAKGTFFFLNFFYPVFFYQAFRAVSHLCLTQAFIAQILFAVYKTHCFRQCARSCSVYKLIHASVRIHTFFKVH